MVKSSNASAVQNGFLFQINVAIYLMIKYMGDIDTIRVEGEKEDVELKLTTQTMILAQVKSQWKDLENTANVPAKLAGALSSLKNADKGNVESLMYVCNFIDPLCSNDNEYIAYAGVTQRRYSELCSASRNAIDIQLQKLGISDFKLDKLWVVRIPFFGDDEDEKHKIIYDAVKEFLAGIGGNLSYKRFVRDWESKFLNNGASSPAIVITKNEILSRLIMLSMEGLDAMKYCDEISSDRDAYMDAIEVYSNFINEEQNRYESICKVIALFKRRRMRQQLTRGEFVRQEKMKLYRYFFDVDCTDTLKLNAEERLDMLASQIVAYAILRNESIINQINEKAGK